MKQKMRSLTGLRKKPNATTDLFLNTFHIVGKGKVRGKLVG